MVRNAWETYIAQGRGGPNAQWTSVYMPFKTWLNPHKQNPGIFPWKGCSVLQMITACGQIDDLTQTFRGHEASSRQHIFWALEDYDKYSGNDFYDMKIDLTLTTQNFLKFSMADGTPNNRFSKRRYHRDLLKRLEGIAKESTGNEEEYRAKIPLQELLPRDLASNRKLSDQIRIPPIKFGFHPINNTEIKATQSFTENFGDYISHFGSGAFFNKLNHGPIESWKRVELELKEKELDIAKEILNVNKSKNIAAGVKSKKNENQIISDKENENIFQEFYDQEQLITWNEIREIVLKKFKGAEYVKEEKLHMATLKQVEKHVVNGKVMNVGLFHTEGFNFYDKMRLDFYREKWGKGRTLHRASIPVWFAQVNGKRIREFPQRIEGDVHIVFDEYFNDLQLGDQIYSLLGQYKFRFEKEDEY